MRDRTIFHPSSLPGFCCSYTEKEQSSSTGRLVDQSTTSQGVQHAEYSMIQSRPTQREIDTCQSHNHVETRHRAAPSVLSHTGPLAEFSGANHELYENSVRPISDSTQSATFKSERAIEPLPSTNTRAGIGTGVWGAVGRAVGSLLGATNLSSAGNTRTCATREIPGSFHQEIASDEDCIAMATDRGQGRSLTDAELRAMYLSQRSAQSRDPAGGYKIDDNHTIVDHKGRDVDDNGPTTASNDGDDDIAVTAILPLSLIPLQPPPDVLAAMGQRRRRSLTPPPDVRQALERARAQREG